MFNWRGLTQRNAGSKVAKAAEKQDITLEIVRPLQAKPGFVLLAPTMDCGKIFRMNNTMQEALKDYQRCISILAVMHIVVFADFMFRNAAALFSQSAYPPPRYGDRGGVPTNGQTDGNASSRKLSGSRRRRMDAHHAIRLIRKWRGERTPPA
ncbi:hypothetical protein AOE01nite_26240 [Acetobacter oeni]|uniref:Uncharacterized protein n=2 Tax=Acetobacter oeni TaxID=304077 RepID=A0A511XN77_9PROT|nr:hypothetical protein AOE01nite_26240 [Acetobacter oeni]